MPGPTDEPDDVAVIATTEDSTAALVWFRCDEPGVASEVRAHVLTALNAWAVDTDTIADAMVLVSELVTNVRHHTSSTSVGVRVRVTADRIAVAVVEQAPEVAPAGGRLPVGALDDPDTLEPRAVRGRGLRILDAVASEWGFVRRAGVTTTWFALPATPPASPDREPEIRRF
ncbi:ATP-binding protein [Jatrophihabitans sp. YIM 134969]